MPTDYKTFWKRYWPTTVAVGVTFLVVLDFLVLSIVEPTGAVRIYDNVPILQIPILFGLLITTPFVSLIDYVANGALRDVGLYECGGGWISFCAPTISGTGITILFYMSVIVVVNHLLVKRRLRREQ